MRVVVFIGFYSIVFVMACSFSVFFFFLLLNSCCFVFLLRCHAFLTCCYEFERCLSC